MGKVMIKGKGRGIRFHQQFLNRPAELRARLLKGEEVELNEGDLKHLLNGSYEIIGKVPSGDKPSESHQQEPDSSSVGVDVTPDEATSSSPRKDEGRDSARKPRHKKFRN